LIIEDHDLGIILKILMLAQTDSMKCENCRNFKRKQMANLEKQVGMRDRKGNSVEHLDERSDGGAIPVAVPGLEVEVRRGAARVLAGLLCGEELGARRPLRVEEPLANH
jgi:hypothetical protein